MLASSPNSAVATLALIGFFFGIPAAMGLIRALLQKGVLEGRRRPPAGRKPESQSPGAGLGEDR